ncbi:MAG: hypothetical protein ACYDCK_13700, partial [Thermoplasmatota archaeon]
TGAPPIVPGPAGLGVNVPRGEPTERRGTTRIPWGAHDSVAMTLSDSPVLAARVLRFGDELYLNRSGVAWTRTNVSDRAPYFSVLTIEFSDVKFLTSRFADWNATTLPNGTTRIFGNGTFANAGGVVTFNLSLVLDGERFVWAQARSRYVPETPYSYAPGPLPNATLEKPTRWLYAPTAIAGNRVAADHHLAIVKLLKAYVANHSGNVPPSVDPSALQAEVAASGKPWPTNAFTGEPLTLARASGAFTWRVCAPDAGQYTGYGWDDAVVTSRLGTGSCSDALPTH